MSFVIAVPEVVAGAAQQLAEIRSSLQEAIATTVGPTSAIAPAAQDEVSVAIASMFGNLGQEFQALSAEAQAFHGQFVELLNSGAGAYLSAEAANVEQVMLGGGILNGQRFGGATASVIQTGEQAISKAVNGFETQIGVLQAGGLPGLINSSEIFGTSVAAPYQALVANTFNNLQAIGTTLVNNPFPIAHQFVNNQIYYGETIASAIGTGVQTLPAELANLPATIQAGFQQLSTFNPAFYATQFLNQQIGYGQTVITGLAATPQDLVKGLLGLPASFQAAGQALLAGDPVGAANQLGRGVESVFLPGFTVANPSPGILSIAPAGALGDLLPILGIPGQMAQNFTDLLPPSIPRLVAQNMTNVIQALTSTTNTLSLFNEASLTFGLPLQVIFDSIGAPINALSALNSSAVAVAAALQSGNVGAAVAAGLGAPAAIANGFLNGTTLLSLPLVDLNPVGLNGFALVEIPFGGILTPLSRPSVFLLADGVILRPTLGGTGFGGLIPGLLSCESELAQAMALPAPTLPLLAF